MVNYSAQKLYVVTSAAALIIALLACALLLAVSASSAFGRPVGIDIAVQNHTGRSFELVQERFEAPQPLFSCCASPFTDESAVGDIDAHQILRIAKTAKRDQLRFRLKYVDVH